MNNIACGVSRGSILGTFAILVNDIVKVLSVLLPILYVDDTSLFLIERTSMYEYAI